jgi:hypothetical protein
MRSESSWRSSLKGLLRVDIWRVTLNACSKFSFSSWSSSWFYSSEMIWFFSAVCSADCSILDTWCIVGAE